MRGLYMKYLIIFLLPLFLIGCDAPSKNTGPMEGIPIEGQVEAYTTMCLRTPASVLCPQEEFFVTNSESLNQQWCELCAKDSSYSWCNHFKECVTEQKPTQFTNSIPGVAPQGETMQGRVVRLRAQAYEDLCTRTPSSVLCK